MKFKRNLLILSAILIAVLILVIGCLPTPTTPPAVSVPSNGTISIAGGAVTTNDTTPSLTISATNATHMAFSGNGTTWSSWVAYATAYSTFNITTGAGCTSGDGTKIVYVKFKNDTGDSLTTANDSIILDTVAPTLTTAAYTDVDSSGTVNKNDRVVFTFNDEMLTSTVTSINAATSLPLSAGSYGTGATISWDITLKICTVTLGTSPTIVFGTTVNPASSVTDTAGNADASSAVTISGLLNILASVSISPATATGTVGTATSQSFTASALSTAATTMTTSCTFTWSISPTTGRGSLSATSGTTVIYTLPATGVTPGNAVITVSGVKTGTTTPVKTDTSTVTVSAATPSSTDPDPAKLSINGSAGTSLFKATYTDIPDGATVRVYSYVSNSPTDAVTAGVKATITISNDPTACDDITDGYYIFFKIFYSGGNTSATTSDGTMPSAPDGDALDAIQATNKNTVTSTAAGTVDLSDKITLYVFTTKYSYPTTVETTMTSTIDLVADNLPQYTRTNPNGHESKLSGPDGKILSPTVTADLVNSTLEVGDTIILTFGSDVIVTEDILLPDISWVTSGSSLFGGNDITPLLGGPLGAAPTVTLTAFTGCVAIGDEEVTFNISITIPIVDDAGKNQVLPLVSAETFDSSDF